MNFKLAIFSTAAQRAQDYTDDMKSDIDAMLREMREERSAA